MLIDKDVEAARVIADEIHAVYMRGIRVGVSPLQIARVMLVDAAKFICVQKKEDDIPLLIVQALKEVRGVRVPSNNKGS